MSEYTMRRYDSIHKFLAVADKAPDENGSSHMARAEWTGTDSFEQAVEWAKNGGWEPPFAPEFRNIFEDLVPKLRKFIDLNLTRFPGPVGDEVNVGMFVEGHPDHMVDWVPQEAMVTKRALCLVIGHSISAGCAAEDLFVRGQALIGLVRALSLLGYELEIWSEETISHRGTRQPGPKIPEFYSTLVRLHAAGDIMDESAIEFAIGNPAWLRRLLFGAQENETMPMRRWYGFVAHGGYGGCEPIQHGNLVGADLELNLGQTWFNERSSRHDPESVSKAGVDWVVSQLKELGVLAEDDDLEWSL